MALLHKAQVSDDLDFLREGVRVLAHALIEEEVTAHVGAKRHQRTAARTGQRNGHRERRWDTRVGSLTLSVPRVRDGGYFPSLLEPRRRAEQALLAVVQEAYVFVRNALALVPKSAQQPVAATIRTVCAQPDAANAQGQWRRMADGFRERFPRLADLMDEAEDDVLAGSPLGSIAFPQAHWRQGWSTNPLERLNKEGKRRTGCPLGRIVGIFPNEGAVLRLVGMILMEQHEEWQGGRCYFSAESLTAVLPCAEQRPLLALR